MRQLFVAIAAAVALVGMSAQPVLAGKVEVVGVHLCCKQCVNTVAKVLAKVDGVSEAKCDQKSKTVSFTAKDSKTAENAVKALVDAGFFGKASDDGKELKVAAPGPKKGEKADEVTVEAVHVCCGACRNAITALFKDAKVAFEGGGVQQTVKVSGKGLDKADVLETLEKAGFYGKVK